LRANAHPELLKVTEAISGPDFTPFNEALFIKEPGIGAAVSWRQDGVTHWDSTYQWNDSARAALKDYNLDDLSI
tara:strand:- start:3810 stop:4031 length:222 start_codon:yes stop_codon:yes gene_type:complete